MSSTTGRRTRRPPSSPRRAKAPKPTPKAIRACGSLRAARCVLDALHSGQPLEVRPAGKMFGVYAPGIDRPLVRRKDEERAALAIDAAREVLEAGRAACPPCDQPVTAAELEARRSTRVVTPQRPAGEPARFVLVEAAELVTSHDPQTFQPDPSYPPNVQEREYHRDQAEQRKVVIGAQQLDPSFILADTPSALDGAPLVTGGPVRLVMGGNGRSMMIRRAYLGDAGERYRAALLEAAPRFGFTSADVQAFAAPVLVRELSAVSSSSPPAELVAAVRRTNEGLTQALSPRARAVAEARTLDPATLGRIGDLLAENADDSLRTIMRDQPARLVQLLEADGVITAQNRSQWLAGGALTDEGKDRLEGLFVGRVVGSGDRLAAMRPALVAKVERATPHLLRVAGVNPAADLIPVVQGAIDVLNDAAARGLQLRELLAQVGMFSGATAAEAPADVQALAGWLEGAGQREVGTRFKAWADLLATDPRQASMFGPPPSPAEALATLTGGRIANPRTPTKRLTCPPCEGRGVLDVPLFSPDAPLPGQARLFNPGCACRLGNPALPVPAAVLSSRARTTEQLAAELKATFGAALPRRLDVSTPIGLVTLEIARGKVKRMRIGRKSADAKLRAAMSADLMGKR